MSKQSRVKVTSPFDGSLVGEVDQLNATQMDDALAKAQTCFHRRDQEFAIPKRREVLEKTRQLLHDRFDVLVETAVKEGGKPRKDTEVEINRGLTGIQVAIETIAQMTGYEVPMRLDNRSMNRIAFVTKEPRGVVGAISAFNHPFNLIIHQVIPALATGCPVLIKPAAATPLSCKHIVDALKESGLPDGWCTFALCDHNVAEKLVTSDPIRYFSFIGSSQIGWMLKAKLNHGATCALEHGGVAPVIVDDTVDIDSVIPGLTKAGYYHAGQVCVSVQRIYVQKRIVETFVDKYVASIQELKTGDPLDANTDVGPLISHKETDRIASWVDASKTSGTILCGGEKISDSLYAPTLVLNPDEDIELSSQEVFGPVVCVYPYDTLDEAITKANRLPVSFQASIFSKNIDTALMCVRRLQARAVMINEHPAFRVDWMPFGGTRESGYGTGGIPYSMHEMMLDKLMVIQSPSL